MSLFSLLRGFVLRQVVIVDRESLRSSGCSRRVREELQPCDMASEVLEWKFCEDFCLLCYFVKYASWSTVSVSSLNFRGGGFFFSGSIVWYSARLVCLRTFKSFVCYS